MRLRLRIERNALPPTQAIWPVKDGRTTIAQLVQQINEVFPLEGDTWGFEDYSVSVGGYECLHYHELVSICKDEDEVVVKPLQYTDVRARTLAGRDQIAGDGRHLVDGVPYGRPCLKGPVRPEVTIPPRKRRKLANGDVVFEQEAPLMLTENEEVLDSDDEEEDEHFDVDESENDSLSSGATPDSESDSEDSDESESDESDTSSSLSDSDSSSNSDSEDDWTGIPTSSQATPISKPADNVTNGSVKHPQLTIQAGSKRKRESHDEDHAVEEGHEIEVDTTTTVLPFQGRRDTKQRNDRRRDAKNLNYLKKMKVVSRKATLQTFRDWRQQNPDWRQALMDGTLEKVQTEEEDSTESGAEEGTKMPYVVPEATDPAQAPVLEVDMLDPAQQLETEVASAVDKSSKTPKRKARVKAAPIKSADVTEQQHRELLSAIASGGVDVTDEVTEPAQKHKRRSKHKLNEEGEVDNEPPEELSTRQQPEFETPSDPADALNHGMTAVNAMVPPSVARRSQLHLASSKRLLFGSLGVKVPKTKEERDLVQKKLAERPKRKAFPWGEDSSALEWMNSNGESTTHGAAIEDVDNPDAWKARINLTAVECLDEGVTLSAPPFPFRQRWDSQYWDKKKGRNSRELMAETPNRKRHKQKSGYIETYDKYNVNGDGDALDYDDAYGEEDEYWEDGALLDGDYDQEVEGDDGFPHLPENVDDLPTLQQTEAQKDDFVAFNELACDKSTEWQPKMVTRTAKIIGVPNGEADGRLWHLQLSTRDLKPKVFDNDGNRVYSKFEMPEDDAEDEGLREVAWTDLGVVRLVFQPGPERRGGGDEGHG